jgi:hypothetical protein
MSKSRSDSAAAAQAERDAISFAPLDIPFDWTNSDWAITHLPDVRIATQMLKRDEEEMRELIRSMTEDGLTPKMLDHMCDTKDHLQALVGLLDNALTRAFLTLERLGYSPDNPPPDLPPVEGSLH